MGIEIHVADVGALSQREIDALATFYACLASKEMVERLVAPRHQEDHVHKQTTEIAVKSSLPSSEIISAFAKMPERTETTGPAFTIAPNDAPDAGAPNLLDEAAAAFGGTPSVFGVSNPPVTPPGNSVEILPNPQVVPTPLGVELDAKGLPWDARIHSSSRAKNADNTWRAKRGVAADVITATEAQLRQLAALPAVPGPVLDGTTGQFIPNVPSPTNLPPGVPPTPASNVAVPSVPAPASPSSPPMTYAQMSMKIMGAINAGQFDHAAVMAACQKHGLSSLPALQLRPDYIPIVIAELFPKG